MAKFGVIKLKILSIWKGCKAGFPDWVTYIVYWVLDVKLQNWSVYSLVIFASSWLCDIVLVLHYKNF